MPRFGTVSGERLVTCHPDLIVLCEEVVTHFDISILCGWRSDNEQGNLFIEGRSKLRAGASRHNAKTPEGRPESRAVDSIPYPFTPEDWQDTRRFFVMWGHFHRVSCELGIPIRWGGDWDRDGSFRDQTFNDLPHIELL